MFHTLVGLSGCVYMKCYMSLNFYNDSNQLHIYYNRLHYIEVIMKVDDFQWDQNKNRLEIILKNALLIRLKLYKDYTTYPFSYFLF